MGHREKQRVRGKVGTTKGCTIPANSIKNPGCKSVYLDFNSGRSG